MNDADEKTLNTIHEILRDALTRTAVGARALGATTPGDLPNSQLGKALIDLRELFKPVSQGMKRAELAFDCLELVNEKIKDREKKATLPFSEGGDLEDEPAGSFVSLPVVLKPGPGPRMLPTQAGGPCPRCLQPFEHQQPAAWVMAALGPDTPRFKVHETCVAESDVRAGDEPADPAQNPAEMARAIAGELAAATGLEVDHASYDQAAAELAAPAEESRYFEGECDRCPHAVTRISAVRVDVLPVGTTILVHDTCLRAGDAVKGVLLTEELIALHPTAITIRALVEANQAAKAPPPDTKTN
jgi:hypothetical protein